jgi:catechol 2,3-dioxygenase-like lactoylglutathione lyase family enzyme
VWSHDARRLARLERLTVKLNHLDLQVADVQRSVAGFTLVLQRRKSAIESYPEGFHFGFLVDDVEAVRGFHARAREAGVVEVSEIIENGRGVLVYLRTWDGLLIEVSCPRERPMKTASRAGETLF